MSTPIVSIAAPVATSRDVLCLHALRVLRTTAQQWGMGGAMPRPQRTPQAQRSGPASSPCAALRAWGLAA